MFSALESSPHLECGGTSGLILPIECSKDDEKSLSYDSVRLHKTLHSTAEPESLLSLRGKLSRCQWSWRGPETLGGPQSPEQLPDDSQQEKQNHTSTVARKWILPKLTWAWKRIPSSRMEFSLIYSLLIGCETLHWGLSNVTPGLLTHRKQETIHPHQMQVSDFIFCHFVTYCRVFCLFNLWFSICKWNDKI